jgi:hypothetical protein
MDFESYHNYFEEIVNGSISIHPYNDAQFIEYTKLNFSRQNRWLKHGDLLSRVMDTIAKIKEVQNWILITEPWCGDAAHSVPFIYKMASLNKHIQLVIQLRDNHSIIENYLTNGSQSIPILVARDCVGNDLFVWGPRPSACQKLHTELKNNNTSIEELKKTLQFWYNKDKGYSIQLEIEELLHKTIS